MIRRSALGIGAFGLLALAGCATPSRPSGGSTSAENQVWSGRLSMRIDSEPAQTFSALFELRGAPEAGELTLTSPIGNTLARLEWSPSQAILRNGNETRRYESLDTLIQAATGAAIPVAALFAWLAGQAQPVPGWRADLSMVGNGRLQATREAPAPSVDLRIVFERA